MSEVRATAPLAVFRADASSAIGTGHVFRCGTLASALAARGWATALATHDLPEPLVAGWPGGSGMIVPLDRDSALASEPRDIATRIGHRARLVVGDHYHLDAAWFEGSRAEQPEAVLMAIDDLADRPQPVDLVLNQNLGVAPAAYDGLVGREARVLIGPFYALVRPAFAALRERGRVRDGRIDRILVFMSGADRADITRRATAAVAGLGCRVDVVVGAAYAHLAEIRALVAATPRATLHVNTDSIAELMDRADLAIGAPSSASWERCALGLPTVLVTLADNQVDVGRELHRLGAAVALGRDADVSTADIEAAVRDLRGDAARVARMSRVAAGVTDGRGTSRVLSEIERLVSGRMAR